MARMRIALAIASALVTAALLAGALFAASCRAPPAGSPCPCVAGFRCDFDRQVCVPLRGAERAWSPQEVNQTGSQPDAGADASVVRTPGIAADASPDAASKDEPDDDRWVIDAGLRGWR
jgi:hypothetical protein